MSEPEQREIAETVFEQTREEIRDAIRLEEERRSALAKTCTAQGPFVCPETKTQCGSKRGQVSVADRRRRVQSFSH
jgi:hypothetical protein